MIAGRRSVPRLALVVGQPGSADHATAQRLSADLAETFEIEVVHTHEGAGRHRTRIDPASAPERARRLFSGQFDLVHVFDRAEVALILQALADGVRDRAQLGPDEARYLGTTLTTSIHDHRWLGEAELQDLSTTLAVTVEAYAVASRSLGTSYTGLAGIPAPTAVLPDGVDTSLVRVMTSLDAWGADRPFRVGVATEPGARPLDAGERAEVARRVAARSATGEGTPPTVEVSSRHIDDLWTDPAAASAWLSSLDAVVMAWSSEARCALALHAMLLGIPVLATRVCLPDALGPLQRQVVLPDESPEAIAQGLSTLIGDAGLRLALTSEAATTAARSDWTIVSAGWSRFFQDALRGAGERDRVQRDLRTELRRAAWRETIALSVATRALGGWPADPRPGQEGGPSPRRTLGPILDAVSVRPDVGPWDRLLVGRDEVRMVPAPHREPPPSPTLGHAPRSTFGPPELPGRSAEPPMVLVVILATAGRPDVTKALDSLGAQSLRAWSAVVVGVVARDLPEARVLEVIDPTGDSVIPNVHGRIVAAAEPYVLFLDARDGLDPTALERWTWCFESTTGIAWLRSRYTQDGAEAADQVPVDAGLAFLADARRSATLMMPRATYLESGGLPAHAAPDTAVDGLVCRLASGGTWGIGLDTADIDTSELSASLAEPVAASRMSAATDIRERMDRGVATGIEARPAAFALPATLPHPVPRRNPVATRPRRALVFLPYLAPGGSEKVVLDLVEQLSGRGWHVTVVATGHGSAGWTDRFRAHTDDVLVLEHFLAPSAVDRSPPIHVPRFIRYLLGSREPELVLISNSAIAYGCVPLMHEVAPTAVVLGIHHAAYWPVLVGEFAQRLDGALVSFSALGERFVEHGMPAERVFPFYTGVDTDRWCPRPAARQRLRQELGTPPDTIVLLSVGRLSSDKRPWMLIEIAAGLRQRGFAPEVWIVGGGPEEARVRAAADRFADQVTVRLLGAPSEERLYQVIPAADVLVLPSEHEGIAVVAFEALASGLPFVGADVGGQRELVTPDVGILIPRTDPEQETRDYVDALAGLLGDLPRLRRMGRAGRSRVEQGFRVQDAADRVELARAAVTRLGHPTHPDGAHIGYFAASLAVGQAFYERQTQDIVAYVAQLERQLGIRGPAAEPAHRDHGGEAGRSASIAARARQTWRGTRSAARRLRG